LHLTPKEIKPSISPEAFIATYKNSKENTSSSPSGQHIGHNKCIINESEIVHIHSTTISLPYQNGFSPTVWWKLVDIMLEKEPGVPCIHRLRIIALMESDFNNANRILFTRQLGFCLGDDNLVSNMEFRSRPGKQCISAVLHKILNYDIICRTKQTAALIENDAIRYYDGMVNFA
jgi:hypothetical protein